MIADPSGKTVTFKRFKVKFLQPFQGRKSDMDAINKERRDIKVSPQENSGAAVKGGACV